MRKRIEVTHRNLAARIVYAPSDGLYHATFSFAGKRPKRSAKSLETVKARILEVMKLAGKGQMNIAGMTGRKLERLNTAVAVLGAEGFNDPLEVANEYINLKRMAEGSRHPGGHQLLQGKLTVN